MPKDTLLRERRSIYCQSDPVLLQFILSEYLLAYPELEKIYTLHPTLERLFHTDRSKQQTQRFLDHLTDNLQVLIGSELINDQPFPWTTDRGALGKLKHYCFLFQNCPQVPAEKSSSLEKSASKSLHSCLQIREILHHLRQHHSLVKEGDAFLRLLERLQESMSKVSTKLIDILEHFCEEERVMLFVLRNEKTFEKIYGEELFDRLHPQGKEGLTTFVKEKYAIRGYSVTVE